MVSAGGIVGGVIGFYRDRPQLVLRWVAAYVAATIAFGLFARATMAWRVAPAPGALPAFPIGSFVLVMAFAIVILAVIAGAVFRTVLRPDDDRASDLRLGIDEGRLIGLMLLLAIILDVAMGAAVIVLALVAALLASVTGMTLGLAAALAGVPALAIMAWLAMRLSLAMPLTVAWRRIVIVPAWRLTRGHGRALLGANVPAGLLMLVLYAILFGLVLGPILPALLHPTDPAAMIDIASFQAAQAGRSLAATLPAILLGGVIGAAMALTLFGMMAIAAGQILTARGDA